MPKPMSVDESKRDDYELDIDNGLGPPCWSESKSSLRAHGPSQTHNPPKAKLWCYESHPPLPLGGERVVYGGSCRHPVVKGADIFVGLDGGMQMSSRHFPWTPGYELLFAIRDMKAPNSPQEFKSLVGWLKDRIDVGDKVHVGCIGGHGRTGMVLAALSHLYGFDKPITYVRSNYCSRAIETKEQIEFLRSHFGGEDVTPNKGGFKAPAEGRTDSPGFTGKGLPKAPRRTKVSPSNTSRSIWGSHL